MVASEMAPAAGLTPVHGWFNSSIVRMWAGEIFTVRRVASPLLDLGSWIHATVEMSGTITNDSVGLVESDNFTFHSPLLLPRSHHSHNRFDSNHTLRTERGAARHTRRTPRTPRGGESSLPAPFLEAPEPRFLFRVRHVDHTHRQLGEAVGPAEGASQSMHIRHVHPRPRPP